MARNRSPRSQPRESVMRFRQCEQPFVLVRFRAHHGAVGSPHAECAPTSALLLHDDGSPVRPCEVDPLMKRVIGHSGEPPFTGGIRPLLHRVGCLQESEVRAPLAEQPVIQAPPGPMTHHAARGGESDFVSPIGKGARGGRTVLTGEKPRHQSMQLVRRAPEVHVCTPSMHHACSLAPRMAPPDDEGDRAARRLSAPANEMLAQTPLPLPQLHDHLGRCAPPLQLPTQKTAPLLAPLARAHDGARGAPPRAHLVSER